MYRSNYKSLFRCHTLTECVNYSLDSSVSKADLFLFLLDTYDILLSHADGSMIFDDDDDLPYLRLAEKLEKYAFVHWHTLFDRIPGQLKGWCEGMFLYVCCSKCRWLASKPGCTVVPSETRDWMKEHRLRTHASYDTASWTAGDLLNALDVLEMKWFEFKTIDQHFMIYLNTLEFRAAWFVAHTAPSGIYDIQKHRIKVSEQQFQIHPALLHDFYVRFMGLRRSFAQSIMFDAQPPIKNMPESRWDEFIEKENRHLSIRKFRDRIADLTWENMARLSDTPRVSYECRGSRVSAYQSVASNRPLSLLDKLNSVCAYSKPPVVHANKFVIEGLHLQMVHAHFMSTYSVNFKNFFFCSSEKSWKHRQTLITSVVPIILERRSRFDVMHRGLIHLVPVGTFAEAFQLWLLIVRRDYRGILYGSMDFGRLCRMMFDPPEAAQQRQISEGAVAYQWDV
jgi:hypothetical protein